MLLLQTRLAMLAQAHQTVYYLLARLVEERQLLLLRLRVPLLPLLEEDLVLVLVRQVARLRQLLLADRHCLCSLVWLWRP